MCFRRVAAGVLLATYLTGCSSSWQTQEASPQQVVSEQQPDQVPVTFPSGNQIVVDQPQVSGDTLRGFDNGTPVEIPVANVSSLALWKRNSTAVTLVVVAVGFVAVAGAWYLVQCDGDLSCNP